MATYTLPVTKKGSITIPKEIRKVLDMDLNSEAVKVILDIDEITKRIEIKRVVKSISSLKKLIKPRFAKVSESKFKQILAEEKLEKYKYKK